ncbi:hypothetical protein GCK32_014089 [Trichostrongylus colubriformis]|uniref:Uncharacterized protein n=1 Tax=Trichostrongylus colubriformis TaxID=6319 RepID=A0AAN8J3L3_TRICO
MIASRIVMLPVLLIGIVSAICSANKPSERSDYLEHGRLALAVDIPRRSSNISSEVYKCLREAGYKTVFFPVYNAQKVHAPEWDPNAVSNIRQAIRAGLGVEVYINPRYNLILKGSIQIAEVINYFNAANLKTKRIWVQVSKPEEWDQSPESNRDFLEDMISAAKGLGVDIGFYTNANYWITITRDWKPEGHRLWYRKVNGPGLSGETPANFDDFVRFGKWGRPTVKQFARKERICGELMNQDVYDAHLMKSYGMKLKFRPRS